MACALLVAALDTQPDPPAVNPGPAVGSAVPGKTPIANEHSSGMATVGGGARAIFHFLYESPAPTGLDGPALRDRIALTRHATDSSPPQSH